jgi:hypothetical protein
MYEFIQRSQRQAEEYRNPIAEVTGGCRKCRLFLSVRAFDWNRILNTPVRCERPPPPPGTSLPNSAVTNSENEIHFRRVGGRESRPLV